MDQFGVTAEPAALIRFGACGFTPMHPANRFAMNGWRAALNATALGLSRALVAAVLAEDQAARLTEPGKSGFHTLPRLRLTQDPLQLLRK